MFLKLYWSLVSAVGRGVCRTEGVPSAFSVFVAAGLGGGVFVTFCASNPDPATVLFLRVIGIACLIFYGTLLWLFVARQRAGTWGATCDYGYEIFSRRSPLVAASASPVIRDIPNPADVHTGINIKRVIECFAISAQVPVFVDGQEIGQIPFGASRLFALTPGVHQVHVAMDWCRCDPITVTVNPGEVVHLKCGCRFRFLFPLNMIGLVGWPTRFFFVREIKRGRS